jgi:hypothetical protein
MTTKPPVGNGDRDDASRELRRLRRPRWAS